MSAPTPLLLIDDDVRLAEMLTSYLGSRGFAVAHQTHVASGLAAARATPPQVILLDVMLPDGDGFDLLRQLRQHSQVPVVMLTARGEDTDRIVGLEMGADDYLPKPFNPRELLARIKAVLRRSGAHESPPASRVLRFGGLEIELDARRVRLHGAEVSLTGHQFELLRALAERAGTVLSRDALAAATGAPEPGPFDRSIDVHISRIRHAIEEDPRRPRRILTLRGAGYLFARQQD